MKRLGHEAARMCRCQCSRRLSIFPIRIKNGFVGDSTIINGKQHAHTPNTHTTHTKTHALKLRFGCFWLDFTRDQVEYYMNETHRITIYKLAVNRICARCTPCAMHTQCSKSA